MSFQLRLAQVPWNSFAGQENEERAKERERESERGNSARRRHVGNVLSMHEEKLQRRRNRKVEKTQGLFRIHRKAVAFQILTVNISHSLLDASDIPMFKRMIYTWLFFSLLSSHWIHQHFYSRGYNKTKENIVSKSTGVNIEVKINCLIRELGENKIKCPGRIFTLSWPIQESFCLSRDVTYAIPKRKYFSFIFPTAILSPSFHILRLNWFSVLADLLKNKFGGNPQESFWPNK